MLPHEDIEKLLPAYALGCLNDAKVVQITEHLINCPACQFQLGAIQATVEKLALAAPQTTPRPALQTRLQQRVKAEETPTAWQSQPGPAWWRQVLRSNLAWGLLGLLLIVVLGISNVLLWQQINQLQPSSPAQSPAMTTLLLRSSQVASAASGMIVISADGEYGALIVENLPALPADRQYQFWLNDGEQKISGALFSVDDEGYQVVEVESPQPLSHYTIFGVTVEPAGGSSTPTSRKVLTLP